MNLNEIFPEHSTLRISAIVDHLIRHFCIPAHARELALVLGDGTESCPRDALRRWVTAQCRELVGQDIELPLQRIEYRLADHLQEHDYDMTNLELPSPAARRLHTPLPDPDQKLAIARPLRNCLDESRPPRPK